jgi:hypothetical protein
MIVLHISATLIAAMIFIGVLLATAEESQTSAQKIRIL